MEMEDKESRVVHLLGVRIHSFTKADFFQELLRLLQVQPRRVVANVNLRAMNLAYENSWFRDFLNQADLVFCDGEGVRLGARLLGQTILERFTPADWVWEFARIAENKGVTWFLLGNPPGVAERAAERLMETYPNLKIVGTHHGHFDLRRESAENRSVVGIINPLKPDMLFVGMGMPTQERWILENLSELECRMVITCGALFEYIAGDLKRGPAWMTQHCLEWLARVMISPKRYLQRYVADIPKFYWRVLKAWVSDQLRKITKAR